MDKSLWGHTVFAVITAIAAYVAWTAPSLDATETVEMISGAPASLTKVSWHEERWDVSLVRRAKSDAFDITVQRLNPPPKVPKVPKADTADGTEADTDEQTETPDAVEPAGAEPADSEPANSEEPKEPLEAPKPAETFPTTDKMADILAKVAPLEAARSLGKVATEKLAAMGLDEPASRLILVFGDKEHVVQIGDATFGGGDIYALRADGEVFLLPAATLANMRHGATALQDKNVIGTKQDEVVRLNVTAGVETRELSQRHQKDEKTRFFSDPAEPDEKLELASKWAERLWRLRVMRFADGAPGGTPTLAVELFGENGKALDVLQIWTPDDSEAIAVSSRYEKPLLIAKTSADSLLKDLPALLSEGR
ncbi:MAG: hypothetical protein A2289_20020 [Deltaproteobacteria bacterium RIFOXYA12_FULL_58_15]|nr:MAG: hypothetical protein A2289_20020 [Deltaproteobacteria bacterium RIFOXYA12_FULL_58_15]